MSRIMTTVITSLLFTGMSLAQDTSASDQGTIRLLVQQVKELQEKVKALEATNSRTRRLPRRSLLRSSRAWRSKPQTRINRQLLRRLCTNHTAFSGAASERCITRSWTSESRSCQLLDLCLVRPAFSIPASSPFFLPPESMTRPACSPKSCLMNMLNIDGSQVESDEDNGNHVNLGLFARPDVIPALQFGGSFYHDHLTNHDFTRATRLAH